MGYLAGLALAVGGAVLGNVLAAGIGFTVTAVFLFMTIKMIGDL